MEALIFAGLAGAGFLLNQKKDIEVKPVVNQNRNINNRPSTLKDNKILQEYLQNKNDIANDLNNVVLQVKPDDKIINPDRVNAMEYLTNDKGIKQQPYFGRNAPGNPNLNSNIQLMAHQGGDIKRDKKEIGQMFAPQRYSGNVFGSMFEGPESDKNRYIPGKFHTNELPYEQEKIVKIDEKNPINLDIAREYAEKNKVDNRRTLNNQKNVYGGRIIHGKYIDQRGQQAPVQKKKPYRDYKNSMDRSFVAPAEVEGALVRPEEILPETNRHHLNKQPLGHAAPAETQEEMRRPLVHQSDKIQLGVSTERNVCGLNSQNSRLLDYKLLGYKAYPNERQVTVERTEQLNLKTYINDPTVGLQDDMKKTIKQTVMYSDNRNPNTYIEEDTSRMNYCNMETDPSKEIISQGREPTLSNVKLTNGMDTVNMDIKKIDCDYMTQREVPINNIYQKIPSDFKCQITTDKKTVDNDKLYDRNYPEQLDPFRNNPFTQPLSSYSFN